MSSSAGIEGKAVMMRKASMTLVVAESCKTMQRTSWQNTGRGRAARSSGKQKLPPDRFLIQEASPSKSL